MGWSKIMLPLCILVFAIFALVQFGVSQWRAIWISTANQPLSEGWQRRAGMEATSVGPGDFAALVGLCDKMSPGLKKASAWLSEVSLYYRVLTKLHQLLGLKIPSLSAWTLREMQTCSRYAAVVLDQRLSMSLDRGLAVRGN
jgi:hypothetical protein